MVTIYGLAVLGQNSEAKQGRDRVASKFFGQEEWTAAFRQAMSWSPPLLWAFGLKFFVVRCSVFIWFVVDGLGVYLWGLVHVCAGSAKLPFGNRVLRRMLVDLCTVATYDQP